MNLRATAAGLLLEQFGVFLTVFDSCPNFTINPATLPSGQAGAPYPPTQITATGATPPFSVVLETGTLPQGMTFVSGLLSGTPQEAGGFPLAFRATSLNQCLATLSTQLTIGGPSCATVVTPEVTLGGLRRIELSRSCALQVHLCHGRRQYVAAAEHVNAAAAR